MTRCLALLPLLLLAPVASAAGPPTPADLFTVSSPASTVIPPTVPAADACSATCCPHEDGSCDCSCGCGDGERRFLESDRAFPGFIGPISNPILTKDPRALTEARFLFISDYIPSEHPFNGGDFQVYGLELRAALTDRLSFIADKDGLLSIHPHAGPSNTGWLNIAAGLKYAFIRDVENQFLVVGGFMYEPHTGEAKVFQGQGDGVWTFFSTIGKEFAGCHHLIGNFGYQFPVRDQENSSFFYTSLHLDRGWNGWLYTLVELNWFHWTQGGNRGLPAALGEGDGLINLGTSGVAGNDLVTSAVGLKAIVNRHLDVGTAFEFPLSNRKDLIDSRLLVEMIFRY
ncbi:MAG: hypothetical protein HYS12_15935 [Planctomycetes bacterium]|nr:hypothetical protein [Planctomycetota bacterium]